MQPEFEVILERREQLGKGPQVKTESDAPTPVAILDTPPLPGTAV